MRCDVCNLPDSYNGQGDGIGSCGCPRCDGACGVADGSSLCGCPSEDEMEQWETEPPCWVRSPGGLRCGLDIDHDGDHYFNTSEAP